MTAAQSRLSERTSSQSLLRNVNEVIAHVVSQRLASAVSANDDVNRSQSSNDVIPTAIHVAAALMIRRELLPAMRLLSNALAARAAEFATLVKTGRTHLMDAMPVTLGQEIGAWQAQIDAAIARFEAMAPRLQALAQGGTAVGTGINARPEFAPLFARCLSERTGIEFHPNSNLLAALSSQDTAVEVSGNAKTLAVSLTKICNDLRWMNSGPLSGLGEISLPALQPRSSIMPGKVNPVIPEAVAMMAAQIVGNDAVVTLAAQSGNFQLNVMLPVIAHNLLQSLQLASLGCHSLAQKAIAGFQVNREQMAAQLERNPILVTALNPLIGYEKGAAIAKRAYEQRRPILDVAVEMTGMDRASLSAALDAYQLTRGGLHSGSGPT